MLRGATTLDANLKLIRCNAAHSAASLPNMMAKEAYHLTLEPASSGLFGVGLSSLLERCGKLMAKKHQQSLHEAVIRSMKTGKVPGQHESKQSTPRSGPKKDQHQKRKWPAKSKACPPAPKGDGKSDAHP